MAKNVTLMGADYPDVPAVELPETGGGTASFFEISDTTAALADVLPGKYVYIADGTRGEGTLSNQKLGFSYCTCSTAAATIEKDALAADGFIRNNNGLVAVKFDNDVPADAELNVAASGGSISYKNILHMGANIKAGVINGGDTALFVEKIPYWHLLAVDRGATPYKTATETITPTSVGAGYVLLTSVPLTKPLVSAYSTNRDGWLLLPTRDSRVSTTYWCLGAAAGTLSGSYDITEIYGNV